MWETCPSASGSIHSRGNTKKEAAPCLIVAALSISPAGLQLRAQLLCPNCESRLRRNSVSLPFFIFPYAGMIQIRFNGCFLSSQADKSTPQCHFIILPYSPFLKQILGTFQFLPIHSCLVFRLVHRHRMRWNFHTLFAPKFVCPPVEWNYKGFRSILYRHVCCCLICLKHRLMSL